MPEKNPAVDSNPAAASQTVRDSTTPARRAAVVVNPAKSGGQALKGAIFRLCETQGWAEPLWLETTVEDPGAGQAREALEAGVDVVIAAGGDGTVRCVAEVLAGTGTPMGLVPLGTGNLLARNLGVDITDPVSACYDVLNGSEQGHRRRQGPAEPLRRRAGVPGDGRTRLRRRHHGRHRRCAEGPHGVAGVRGGRHPQTPRQAGQGERSASTAAIPSAAGSAAS